MAFDRYAYTLNNPLRYTDPTGHGACDDAVKVPECDNVDPDGDGKVPHPNHPTPVSLADLDGYDAIGMTGISGTDFYNWYLDLWYKNGWWWDMFGRDGDEFTVWDAFAVIYYFETNGHWSDPNISEAAIRDANTWCHDPKVGGGACTVDGKTVLCISQRHRPF